jgi:hypothetical protein
MRLTRVPSDDRGSLLMVLLVITIGLGLSALLTPIIVRQFENTRMSEDRNTALNAAQAALDMVMARIRAAEALSEGLLENLPPCEFAGDAGVDGVGQSMEYSVNIIYKDGDGKVLECDPNRPDHGPTRVPTRAELSVKGESAQTVVKGEIRQTTRQLTATYFFSTDNSNIAGGQIRISTTPLGSDQCLDMGSEKSPTAGTEVTMQACNGSSRQQLSYTEELNLKLVNSESSHAEFGMCLHAGATHSDNSIVVLQPCPSTKPSLFQWSLDGSSMFRATSKDGKTESFCMIVKTPNTTGGKVGLGVCSANGDTTVWRSAASVGAGMAGEGTKQMVNYSQFSRCLDVTDKETSRTYMIAWFCKQSPDGTVEWNQRWFHPVPVLPEISKTGKINITKDLVPTAGSVWYCLKSPESTAPNVYVTLVACKGNESTPATEWNVYQDTGDNATSYRVLDSMGYCLTPTDLNANPKDTHSDGTSKVKVAVCSSSLLQKWNAPPNFSDPTPLKDVGEK